MFSCEFVEISKNTCFYRTRLVAVSDYFTKISILDVWVGSEYSYGQKKTFLVKIQKIKIRLLEEKPGSREKAFSCSVWILSILLSLGLIFKLLCWINNMADAALE